MNGVQVSKMYLTSLSELLGEEPVSFSGLIHSLLTHSFRPSRLTRTVSRSSLALRRWCLFRPLVEIPTCQVRDLSPSIPKVRTEEVSTTRSIGGSESK